MDQFAEQKKERRKFLYGLGLLSLIPLLKLRFFNKQKEAINCVVPAPASVQKLLTEDGQLVEVDMSKVNAVKKKVTDKELQEWIKKQ
ncbi:MAG: hypothetical protein EKK37_15230 [Sphingobacteriales bacterium]|nr:MAG: hypothetical protein EKK37_15230 [Sphingobacteriales bacterium]